jgi:hypothetical protein
MNLNANNCEMADGRLSGAAASPRSSCSGSPSAWGPLKAKYLDCFAARTSSAQTLPEVIKSLLQLGVVRATLFRWGIAAGYSRATVRSLLSRAFCALGLRQRRAGAGRKPCAGALELLAHSRRQYGSRALRMLHAAYRAGKTQDARRAKLSSRPIVAPQLDSAGRNSGAAKRTHTNGQHGRLARLATRNVSESLRKQ